MEKITWKTQSGSKAEVAISLVTERVINADGHSVVTHCCEIRIEATVDGRDMGYGEPIEINHPIAVARIGNLAMTAENFVRVEAAIAKIKSAPDWIEKREREATAIAAEREYQEGYEKIKRAMGK